MTDEVVERILKTEKDLTHYPDIHNYDETRNESFWVLEVASKEFDVDWLTSNQIAEILVERFEISRTSRAVGSALGKAFKDGFVHKNEKTNEFKLMKKGRDDLYLVQSKNPGVYYIEPGKPFSAKVVLFNKILSEMKNKVWICDTHIGIRLLDILHTLDPGIDIRMMAIQVHSKDIFKRSLADFRTEHPSTEVREAPPGEVHDRYVISDSGMWLVGHSLKDLGSKESFIVRVGDDLRNSMESIFEERWSRSKPVS